MSMATGIIAITLFSLFLTYLFFGRGLRNSPRQNFFYWFKSTVLLTLFIFIWLVHKEPAAFGFTGFLISAGLSGVANFGRPYFAAMFT